MGRMFRVIVENEWIEDCVVVDYKAHPVNRQLFFVRFNRHIPGSITEVGKILMLYFWQSFSLSYSLNFHVSSSIAYNILINEELKVVVSMRIK